jgi:hypothetical protein
MARYGKAERLGSPANHFDAERRCSGLDGSHEHLDCGDVSGLMMKATRAIEGTIGPYPVPGRLGFASTVLPVIAKGFIAGRKGRA